MESVLAVSICHGVIVYPNSTCRVRQKPDAFLFLRGHAAGRTGRDTQTAAQTRVTLL